MTPRPHFIGIGAHKAGTTWLYRNLRGHPELWLPPIKELHVFDGLPNLPRVTRRLEEAIAAQARGERTEDVEIIEFLRRFVLPHPKDETWYRSLFVEAGERICGEITPAYSIIETDQIGRVHALLPTVKIVFIMRNPIERTWSHLRSDAGKPGLDPARMSLDELRHRIDSPVSELRTRYTRTLANWERCFSREQFLLLFYDDIVENPDALLKKVCDFLGVDYRSHYFEASRAQRVHESIELPIRPEISLYLARKYREEIVALQRRLGGHADKWLADCEALLNDGR
jgi:hypothetical protein